jgi:acyl carrier protein
MTDKTIMTNKTDTIRRVIADVFAVDASSVTLDASPQTIEAWDSMGHLNLVLALEQEFGAQFSPEEIAAMTSVRAIEAVLLTKG